MPLWGRGKRGQGVEGSKAKLAHGKFEINQEMSTYASYSFTHGNYSRSASRLKSQKFS